MGKRKTLGEKKQELESRRKKVTAIGSDIELAEGQFAGSTNFSCDLVGTQFNPNCLGHELGEEIPLGQMFVTNPECSSDGKTARAICSRCEATFIRRAGHKTKSKAPTTKTMRESLQSRLFHLRGDEKAAQQAVEWLERDLSSDAEFDRLFVAGNLQEEEPEEPKASGGGALRALDGGQPARATTSVGRKLVEAGASAGA